MQITRAGERPCGKAGALCTGDGRSLSNTVLGNVAGPAQDIDGDGSTEDTEPEVTVTALTATFSDAPTEHDGTTPFRVKLGFSETIFEATSGGDKNQKVREAIGVTGGTVKGTRRVDRGEYDQWWITVTPAGTGQVTVSIGPKTSCTASGAICTPAGVKLSNKGLHEHPGATWPLRRRCAGGRSSRCRARVRSNAGPGISLDGDRRLCDVGRLGAMSLSLLKFVGQASLVDDAMLPS